MNILEISRAPSNLFQELFKTMGSSKTVIIFATS